MRNDKAQKIQISKRISKRISKINIKKQVIIATKIIYKNPPIPSSLSQNEIVTNPSTLMSQNQQSHPLNPENEKKNSQEPEQLLLPPQPQDQLIDFGEIVGFLREKHHQLANELNFCHEQNIFDPNFDEKHTHERNLQQHYENHDNQRSFNHFNPVNDHHANKYQHHDFKQNQETQKPIQQKRKCICKKTQCLKMYCECFASNLPCTQECACFSCKNTLEHQKEIIQAKMMIQQKGVVGLHSCSLSEKRCNCKKSGCLKKYCECYNSGVKCTEGCKCIGCKNCDNPKNQSEQFLDLGQKLSKARKDKKDKNKTEKVSN